MIEPHRHEGVFIARGSKEDTLVTLNSTPGKDVYGEKRIAADGPPGPDGVPTKLEYRVWNPFRSKLAASILGGELHTQLRIYASGGFLSNHSSAVYSLHGNVSVAVQVWTTSTWALAPRCSTSVRPRERLCRTCLISLDLPAACTRWSSRTAPAET